jgi:thioredoxin reductase
VTPPDTVPAVVVGAGPYGLAVAAHLKGLGVGCRVFGEPMEAWRARMPVGMFLKSTPRASDIADPTGRYGLNDYRVGHGKPSVGDLYPVPVAEFIAYGEWFQQQRVPEVERTTVVSIEPGREGFRLLLERGEVLDARSVVLANGLRPYAWTPAELAPAVEAGLGSHTSEHADLGKFAGQRVAVVGAGQSALESAALMHEAGAAPTVVARRAELVFGDPPDIDRPGDRSAVERVIRPATPLGPGWPLRGYSKLPWGFRYLPDAVRVDRVRRILGPAGAWWLRDRVEGRVPVLTGHTLLGADPSDHGLRLRLDGDTGVLEVDHVLAATGYRVDVARQELLDEGLRRAVRRTDAGAPRLSSGFESSVPGLFFAGLSAADSFGPLMRFVCGTGFAARRISRDVAGRR